MLTLLIHGNRHYIAQARLKRPVVPPIVSNYIVDSYVRLRKLSKEEAAQKKSHTYTSARTLLGVLRLAQALARLRFADIVEHGDVDEALRLMECSKESLEDDEDKEYEPDRSVISQIFRLIKNMAGEGGGKRKKRQRRFGKGPGGERDMDVDSSEDDNDNDGELALIDVRSRVLGAGYTEAQLNDTISEVSWRLLSHTVRCSPSPCVVRIHRRLGTRGKRVKVAFHQRLKNILFFYCFCAVLSIVPSVYSHSLRLIYAEIWS